MSDTTINKQTCCPAGAAIILFLDRWYEMLRIKGKDKDQPYVVPENGTITLRFPVKDHKELIGKQVRIFVESD